MNEIEKLTQFFEQHPSITPSSFSVEMGKNRNYIEQLLKSGKVNKKQLSDFEKVAVKYGYNGNTIL